MATVIDALVVTLGLDPAQYKRGQADAKKSIKTTSDEAARAAKEMEARGQQAALFFTKIRNEALALLAIFTAGMGIKNFAQNTILSTAALGRMSQNLGMSAKDLSEWQLAAKNAGGTAEGITNALLDSQKEVAKFKLTGVTEGINKFLQYGGKASDLKDGNTYLLARARIISNIAKTDPGRAQLVASQMGINEGEYNFLKQGPEAIEKARLAQAGLAEQLARASAPAEELRKRWDSLENKFTSVGVTVLNALMPQLERLLAWFEKIGDYIASHNGDISKWVDQSVASVQKFVEWANKAAESVGGWKNVLIGLAALKLLSMSSGILSLATAFLSLGGALTGVSTAGVAALPVLAKLLGLGGVAALALHSESLNKGEDEYLASRRAKPGQKWPGDPIGDKRRGGPGKDPAARAAAEEFMKMGWSREQASGLTANLWKESLLDPRAVGDGGKAYGIGQWHPDRQDAFKKLFGIDIRNSSLAQQLQFANAELTTGSEQAAGRRLRGATNAMDAGAIVSRYYERPADAEGEATSRAGYAADLYASLGRANAAQIASQAAGAASAAGNTNNVSHSSSSTETHVNGPVNIYTQATDAKGIANAFGAEVKKFNFTISQQNNGMS